MAAYPPDKMSYYPLDFVEVGLVRARPAVDLSVHNAGLQGLQQARLQACGQIKIFTVGLTREPWQSQIKKKTYRISK